MKLRIVLLVVAAALVALGIWSIFRRGARGRNAPRAFAVRPAAPAVPIQDGKTLDFSSGKAVVKDSPADRAALAKGVAEMDAAAATVTFAPIATATSASAPSVAATMSTVTATAKQK